MNPPNFLFILTDGKAARPADGLVFHRLKIHRFAYREGDLKLFVHLDENEQFAKRELFNVKEDPSESSDLAGEYPESVEAFKKPLTGFLESVKKVGS